MHVSRGLVAGALTVLIFTSIVRGQTFDTEMASNEESIRLHPVRSTERVRVDVQQATSTVAAGTEITIYENALGSLTFSPGANVRVADDISTLSTAACEIVGFAFDVIGKVDPMGLGGPFSVEYGLYDTCPGAVPSATLPTRLIAGTDGVVNLTDDGLTHVNVQLAAPSVAPASLWLSLRFSRANAGPVVGAPPSSGHSVDLYHQQGSSACSVNFGTFPSHPHGSFNVTLYGSTSSCDPAFAGYRAIRQTGMPVVVGPNVAVVDDITLGFGPCEMVGLELVVEGAGTYNVELRNTCDGAPIPGTQGSRLVAVSDPNTRTLRFAYDPPILVPDSFWISAQVTTSSAGPKLTGSGAWIGSSADTLGIDDGDGCTIVNYAPGYFDTLEVTVTCAGVRPEAACCERVPRLAGTCRENALPSDCPSLLVTDANCASAGCDELLGACCNESSGSCFDARPLEECSESGQTWYSGSACAEIECLPPPPTGACCLTGGSCLDAVPLSACPTGAGSWHENQACSLIECPAPIGACCRQEGANFSCESNVQTECACGTCQWHEGLECSDIECGDTFDPIPTVSSWGLIILSLLLAVGLKVFAGRSELRQQVL